ncbi:MAG: DNA alkylation repair protein [Christensenellales bacterium]|jgi:3-methyladenine DNA glycosylase AlkD
MKNTNCNKDKTCISNITKYLFTNRDKKYAAFVSRLVPNISPESIIGVRMPVIHALAKKLMADNAHTAFISALPHKYHEENLLHASILSKYKDIDALLPLLKNFLPHIDNWAVCDTLAPKIFLKHNEKALDFIRICLASKHTYTQRFAIYMLMKYYLDDYFDEEYIELVCNIQSDEYYVNMCIAWYFATALAKQYSFAIPVLEENKLSTWTNNKTVEKALDSYRISDDKKQYIKSLTRK